MAILGFQKLGGPLPLISVPGGNPNGEPSTSKTLFTKDPYLEDQSFWTYESAAKLRNIGIYKPCGNPADIVIGQIHNTVPAMGNGRLYLDIETIDGNFFSDIANDGTKAATQKICESGQYILDFANYANSMYLATVDSLYTPDPYFKTVPVEGLPVWSGGALELNRWFSFGAGVRKDTDGSLRISSKDANAAIGGISTNIPNGTACTLEARVRKVPPGATIRFGQTGVVTEPGIYRFSETAEAGGLNGRTFSFRNITATGNADESIVDYIRLVANSHTGPMPDNLFIKMKCMWSGVRSIFDAVIKPETYVAVNQYDVGGAFESSPTPKLGYCGYLPPVGNYNVGDIIRNTNFVSGQPSGWKCTAAGNPGTWQPLAVIP